MMVYDTNKNRLYIPGGQELGVVDISQSSPQTLGGGPIPTCQMFQVPNCIPAVAPSARSAADPCSLTAVQTLNLATVGALPDGSRAYVGAYYVDASDNVCPQVTVIDAASNTVKSSIPIPGFPDATNPANSPDYAPACVAATNPYRATFRFMMAAAGDSTRAYLSSCDGGNVNIIDTSTDSYIANLQAPVGTRSPIPPSLLNPPQNPVFLIAGP